LRNAESDKLACRCIRMLYRAKRTRDPHKSEIPRELGSDRIVPILTKAGEIYALRERNRERERERVGRERNKFTIARDRSAK